MKKISLYIARYWQVALLGIGVTALLYILYGYGTSTFLPELSAAEQQGIAQTLSLREILTNPLWLPHKLALYIAQKGGMQDTTLRLISALFMLVVVTSFYRITKRFYSTRVSVLTTLLFAVSVSTITLARTATPAVLLYSWLPATMLALWFRHSHKKRFVPFLFFMLMSAVLYTPGTIWFVLFLTLWFWKDVPRLFKHLSNRWIVVGAVLGLLVAAPLIYSFVIDPSLIKSWLLIPTSFDLQKSIETMRTLPAVLFYRSTISAGYNLGALPLLDAFSGTMFLLGLYAYRKKLRLERTIVYAAALVFSSLFCILNNNQLFIFYFMPFVYLLIVEGIGYLLSEWRSVFPKNPIARFVGTILMSVAVISACGYHLNRYFLAWVQAPETKAIYNKKPQE